MLLRSSRSDSLAPSLAALGSESDPAMPVVTTSEKPAFSAAQMRGDVTLVSKPDECAIAVLSDKVIRL